MGWVESVSQSGSVGFASAGRLNLTVNKFCSGIKYVGCLWRKVRRATGVLRRRFKRKALPG